MFMLFAVRSHAQKGVVSGKILDSEDNFTITERYSIGRNE
jgi:hypothetical protein